MKPRMEANKRFFGFPGLESRLFRVVFIWCMFCCVCEHDMDSVRRIDLSISRYLYIE